MIFSTEDSLSFTNATTCHICTEDSLSFTNDTTCHICTKPLTDDDRVRDHCHITGIYCGAAHSACNLNYRITPKSWKLPVVIHNLKGYDGR